MYETDGPPGVLTLLGARRLQALRRLGTEARMNVPGVPEGNWRWRCTEDQVTPALLDWLADLTELYYRQPGPDLRE